MTTQLITWRNMAAPGAPQREHATAMEDPTVLLEVKRVAVGVQTMIVAVFERNIDPQLARTLILHKGLMLEQRNLWRIAKVKVEDLWREMASRGEVQTLRLMHRLPKMTSTELALYRQAENRRKLEARERQGQKARDERAEMLAKRGTRS